MLEIHSRVRQKDRDAAAEAFRTTAQCVLLSSDVSARGVDYPGVSLVVQCGAALQRHAQSAHLRSLFFRRASTAERHARPLAFRKHVYVNMWSGRCSKFAPPRTTYVGAPDSREVYVQRIGRTGRNGARGKSLLLLAQGFDSDFAANALHGLHVACDASPWAAWAAAAAGDAACTSASSDPAALRLAAAAVDDKLASET